MKERQPGRGRREPQEHTSSIEGAAQLVAQSLAGPAPDLTAEGSRWDIEGAAKVLARPAIGEYHPAFGYGIKWSFAESTAANEDPCLYLYPERFLARYRSWSIKVDLANVSSVRPEGEGVRIEASDETTRTVLLVEPNGTLILGATPAGKGRRHNRR